MRLPRPRLSWRRTLGAKFALAALVGLLCAASTAFTVSLAPPGLHARHQTIAAAGLHVLVADPKLPFASPGVTNGDVLVLTKRTQLYATMMVSQPVVALTAAKLGIPAASIGAISRLTSNAPAAMLDPDLERHANELLASRKPFRLDVQADPNLPVINVYAAAPSPDGAVALASAAVDALERELVAWRADHVAGTDRSVVLRVLGEPRGAIVNDNIRPQVLLLTFLLAFGVA
ncbi:MAG TPA: hypothetical protein VGM33_10850, partial [Baekduia sp.]